MAIIPYSDSIYVSPTEDKIFEIDLNTRTIITPTFLSVEKEHKAETIYFLIDRYYEYKDLSQTSCIIEFVNAKKKSSYFYVPFYDILTYEQNRKMLIPWRIEGIATEVSGPVQFALRFFEIDEEGNPSYILKTKVATAQVLKGMEYEDFDDIDYTEIGANLVDQFAERIQLLESAESIIYWNDLD